MGAKQKKIGSTLDGNYDVPALRRKALAAILWRVVIERPEVIEYRTKYLGGRPLPRTKAKAWWESMPEDAPARQQANTICQRIADLIQVEPEDIWRIMIWNHRPEIVPVQIHRWGYSRKLNLVSPMPAAARICLSIAVSATVEEIVAEVKRLRAEHLRIEPDSRDRLQSPKHLHLAMFHAEHADEGALGAVGMERWNREFPQWRYREVKTFNRDVRQASGRLMSAGFGKAVQLVMPVRNA